MLGTSVLLAPRVVATYWHVVREDGPASVTRGEACVHVARVLRHPPIGELPGAEELFGDLALLELEEALGVAAGFPSLLVAVDDKRFTRLQSRLADQGDAERIFIAGFDDLVATNGIVRLQSNALTWATGVLQHRASQHTVELDALDKTGRQQSNVLLLLSKAGLRPRGTAAGTIGAVAYPRAVTGTPETGPRNPTAGAGDPYWYEWAVGLSFVIEMLDPDAGIEHVRFQSKETNGLDDVVVTRRTELVVGAQARASESDTALQVKHTRVGDTLSLGDLVGHSLNGLSLLRRLAEAWGAMRRPERTVVPVLFTNRPLSQSPASSRPAAGGAVYRPPLSAFWPALEREAATADRLSAITMADASWADAWEEFQAEIAGLGESHGFEFLRALRIESDTRTLNELEHEMVAKLVAQFGANEGDAQEMLESLFAALRRWTSARAGPVSVEDVYETLSAKDRGDGTRHAFAPPEPFFQSRADLIARLEDTLAGPTKVVFLTGPPGSGKTSVVSSLANRREPKVDLRFHAFRPISPSDPVLPSDADHRTTAASLWYALLAQLRGRLAGRLARYRVPVRSSYLDPLAARDHVLRISSAWAAELERPVTIAIDGLDHAARAAVRGAAAFLESLLPTAAVPDGVRFLLAGQEPENYDYPVWLGSGCEVVRFVVPALTDDDVVDLLRGVDLTFECELASLARVLNGYARGNTLSVLFAVEEAKTADSVAQFQERLSDRRLAPVLDQYYDRIWSAAVSKLPAFADLRLAAALTLLRVRLTAPLLARLFPDTRGDWALCLAAMRPLVVAEGDGFRLLHNDVGVFLQRVLRANEDKLRTLASDIADFLIRTDDLPEARHASILGLLRLAARETEFAGLCTPSYVMEAWEVNRPIDEVEAQVRAALVRAATGRNVETLLQVCQAARTLFRIDNAVDRLGLQWPRPTAGALVPQPKPSELCVPQLGGWTASLIRRTCSDVRALHGAGSADRAVGVVRRWFGGLSALETLPWRDEGQRLDGPDDLGILVAIGECLALVDTPGIVAPPRAETESDSDADALLSRGLLRQGAETSSLRGWVRVLSRVGVVYPGDVRAAVRKLVERRAWRHVGLLLQRFSHHWSSRVRPEDTLFVALGLAVGEPGAAERAPAVVADILRLAADAGELMPTAKLEAVASLAFVWAWVERSRATSDVVSNLAYTSTLQQHRAAGFGNEVLRAAAVAGRAASTVRARGQDAAREAVPPSELREALAALVVSDGLLTEDHSIRVAIVHVIAEFSMFVVGEHDLAVTDVLCTAALSCPGGPLGEAIWHELHRRNRAKELRAWGLRQLDPVGPSAKLRATDRFQQIDRFARLADGIGISTLAAGARRHQLLTIASYYESEDDALSPALKWFNLAQDAGEPVGEEGNRLLGLSRLMDRLGEDTQGPWIEASCVRALVDRGPRYVARLWAAPGNWLPPETPPLFSGLILALEHGDFSRDDLVALWCLAVGALPLRRDFERFLLGDFRNAVEAAAKRLGHLEVVSWIGSRSLREATMSGGERHFRSYESWWIERDPPEAPGGGDVRGAALKLFDAHRGGNDNVFRELADLLEWSTRGTPELAGALAENVMDFLDEVRTGAPWFFDGRDRVYSALAGLPMDASRWWEVAAKLAEDAQREPTEHSLFAMVRNLDLVCHHVAVAERADLRALLRTELDLQGLWVRGAVGDAGAEVPLRDHPGEPDFLVDTWRHVAMALLADLLATDDALGIATGLRGLALLLDDAPSLFQDFAALISRQEPRMKLWCGYILEWLSAKRPSQVADAFEQQLSRWLVDGDLPLRVQAWVVLTSCARAGACELPTWPTGSVTERRAGLLVVGRGFLSLPPTRDGIVQTSAGARAARTTIHRIAAVLGEDATALEAHAAALPQPPPQTQREPRSRGYRRLVLSPERANVLHALRQRIDAGSLTDTPVEHIAQAACSGDDPFIFLEGGDGPGDEGWDLMYEVTSLLESGDRARVRDLLLAITRGGLSDDLTVLCATCTVFTPKHDVELSVHQRVLRNDGNHPIDGEAYTLNARTFALFGDARWESAGVTSGWLTVPVGGTNAFPNSGYTTVPSKRLQASAGWELDPSRPTRFAHDGRHVVWHQQIHGPVNEERLREDRHPVLSRWVVEEEEWRRVLAVLKPEEPVGVPTLHIHPFEA